jgi:hypothetical protein
MAKHYDDDGPTHGSGVNASSLSKGKEGSESFEVVRPGPPLESTETKAKEETRTGVLPMDCAAGEAASLPLLRRIAKTVKSHPVIMVPSRQAAGKISRTSIDMLRLPFPTEEL